MLTIQLITWLMMLLQEDVPPIYREFLNAETIANVLVIVGGVKLVRNIVNLKGFAAVVVTVVASFAYGLLQFGLTGGLVNGLVLSALSVGVFYITKNIGTVLNAYGIGNLKKIIPDTLKFIKEHPEFMKKIMLGLRYVFVRK